MILKQEWVPECPIDRLSEHPENPRRGDEDAIEASLDEHGFYGAVLVQSSSGRVIAGNHRLRRMKARGEATIPALVIDVDDDEALRILLNDNRASDLAHTDDVVLDRVLAQLAATDTGLSGTGYTDDDRAQLNAAQNLAAEPNVTPTALPTPAVSSIIVTYPTEYAVVLREHLTTLAQQLGVETQSAVVAALIERAVAAS